MAIVCPAMMGLALICGGMAAYSSGAGVVTISVGGTPRDTIGVVSSVNAPTLDDRTISAEALELIVDKPENVQIQVSAPEDSTVAMIMTMHISDILPAPEGGIPDSMSVTVVNPSILTDGVGYSRMEVVDLKLTSLSVPADSALHLSEE